MLRPARPARLVPTVLAAVVALGTGGPFAGRLAAAAGRQATVPKQLLVTLHVVDKKGVPLTDVTASEIEVMENGKSRPVQGLQLDQRPLAVALVLDNNSELSTAYMQSVVPAGIAVFKALPPDTPIDVWTSGDRPTQIVKAANAEAAEKALKGTAAIGVNALLYTVAEASKALPQDDAHRGAVIVMTTGTLGDSGGASNEQALKQTSMKPTFFALEWVMKQADARVENMLEFVANNTGGLFDRVLSVTAFEKRGPQLVALANAQYRLAWEPSGDPRETKIEFKCNRKGAKVVASQRISAIW